MEVGFNEGNMVTKEVGAIVDGSIDGDAIGVDVGVFWGNLVGSGLGGFVGLMVGSEEGLSVDGFLVGLTDDGARVGEVEQ